jgi:hypothetical protein
MPLNLAQWTGIAVTSIVVLGTDLDVVYAVPLGFMAGALATLFSTLANEGLRVARKDPLAASGLPAAKVSMVKPPPR